MPISASIRPTPSLAQDSYVLAVFLSLHVSDREVVQLAHNASSAQEDKSTLLASAVLAPRVNFSSMASVLNVPPELHTTHHYKNA